MVNPTIFSFVLIFFPKSLGILDTEGKKMNKIIYSKNKNKITIKNK